MAARSINPRIFRAARDLGLKVVGLGLLAGSIPHH